jgi:hypothetical protein
MPNTGFKGMHVRQTGNAIIFDLPLQATGGLLLTGTTYIYLYELQADGSLKVFDWSTQTFNATTPPAGSERNTMNLQSVGAIVSGIWTFVFTTPMLAAFTVGGIYWARAVNTGASPVDNFTRFQYGSAEGDLMVAPGATGQGYMRSDLEYVGGAPMAQGTLNLKQLNVVNANGNAVTFNSQAGGAGVHIESATSNALELNAPGGIGAYLTTYGYCVYAQTTGSIGVHIGSSINTALEIASGGGDAIHLTGTGHCLYAQSTGGSAFHIESTATAASAHGIEMSTQGGDAIHIAAHGYCLWASTTGGGTGVHIDAGFNALELASTGNTNGDAIYITSNSGQCLYAKTTGSHAFDIESTVGDALHLVAGGAGAGLAATGAAGPGARFKAGSGNNHGLELVHSGTGQDLLGTYVPANNVHYFWTMTMAESYAALHTSPTPIQALFELLSSVQEMEVPKGTKVMTTYKRDGVTTAMQFDLDDPVNPTWRSRVT